MTEAERIHHANRTAAADNASAAEDAPTREMTDLVDSLLTRAGVANPGRTRVA